jgi:hypothetical protein
MRKQVHSLVACESGSSANWKAVHKTGFETMSLQLKPILSAAREAASMGWAYDKKFAPHAR